MYKIQAFIYEFQLLIIRLYVYTPILHYMFHIIETLL